MASFGRAPVMPTPEQALPGRDDAMPVPAAHFVTGHRLTPPFPDGFQTAVFDLGCGVSTTAVGYAGGSTPNPTYQEVCTGRTGHTEAVLVVFDPSVVTYEQLLKVFWEHHHTSSPEQQEAAERSREGYGEVLRAAHFGDVTTEIAPGGPSTTRRTTTSSTWPRTPVADAASAARA